MAVELVREGDGGEDDRLPIRIVVPLGGRAPKRAWEASWNKSGGRHRMHGEGPHTETHKQKQTQEDVNGIMRYESTGREDSMKKEKSRESPLYRKSDPEGSREVKRAEKGREKGSEERMS